MSYEIEMKFPVSSLAPVRRALRRQRAVYLGTVLQTDRYFDTPKRSLMRADRGLRIRQVRVLRTGAGDVDRRPQLTAKGPVKTNSRAKVRRERQIHIDDADAMVDVLTVCGLRPTVTIQKRRASYRLGDCLVELDELPLVGFFVEIEGPDERRISRVARKLDLDVEPSKAHYIDLLRAACKRAGKNCREVTFETCKPSCRKR